MIRNISKWLLFSTLLAACGTQQAGNSSKATTQSNSRAGFSDKCLSGTPVSIEWGRNGGAQLLTRIEFGTNDDSTLQMLAARKDEHTKRNNDDIHQGDPRNESFFNKSIDHEVSANVYALSYTFLLLDEVVVCVPKDKKIQVKHIESFVVGKESDPLVLTLPSGEYDPKSIEKIDIELNKKFNLHLKFTTLK